MDPLWICPVQGSSGNVDIRSPDEKEEATMKADMGWKREGLFGVMLAALAAAADWADGR